MMEPNAHLSVQGALIGLGVLSYYFLKCLIEDTIFKLLGIEWVTYGPYISVAIYCSCFYMLVNVIILTLYCGLAKKILQHACFLGTVFGMGIILKSIVPIYCQPFILYILVLSFFHFSEYFVTAVTNPTTVTIDSFLLNHSFGYWAAAVISWIEYGLQTYFYPGMKVNVYLKWTGLIMCTTGEIIRKSSMVTAGSNFNHIVQVEKKEDHKLITSGIYSLFRHPSYVGWFLWSVGTQVLLSNPLCFIIYTMISWHFFRKRIYFEEMFLIEFFGEKYIQYKRKVWSGIPFVVGYQIRR